MTLRPRLATGLPFSPWHFWLQGLSVRAGSELDRTCVHESVGKIQVVQLRRVLLLFALVLGLSALVATLAPPPDDTEQEAREEPAPAIETPVTAPAAATRVSIAFRGPHARPATRRVRMGSSFSLEVTVPAPGEVLLEDLGLRQPADPLTPARFTLLAEPRGRHDVIFAPVSGERRVVGRLAFVEPLTVTPRRRGR